jgi:pimeloyl-ACP methyl ester carboxylesterase
MAETIRAHMRRFSTEFGRELAVNGTRWRYYRLGTGPALLWLTGGLRRAAFGFAFLERLAPRHTVIAPDYPPVQSLDEFIAGFDAIRRAEGVERAALGGQSYGGLLAQAYLAVRGPAIERLVLSSTGPAGYGAAWLPFGDLAIFLARVLPERFVKGLLAGGLLKLLSVAEAERAEWEAALREILERDLTRQDVVSHFAVAAELIRRRLVYPGVYQSWPGRVVVLSAENDPTQGKNDRAHYEALFGRPVEAVSLGQRGHSALLLDPDGYARLLEGALA